MRGSPENRDKTYEIARGPIFHAEVPRRFGPILAAPGALRDNSRAESGYNPIAPARDQEMRAILVTGNTIPIIYIS